jgi:predicted deacylase
MSQSQTNHTRSILLANHDGEEIRVPYIEIEGESEGPVLTVIAGIHGAEYPGIEAAVRLSRQITSEKLSGTLRIVPICNVPGFLGRCEVQCPIDGKNLNRVFPGSTEQSYTDHLAHVVYENLVTGSDAVLNIHGGDIFEELVPYTGIGVTDNQEVDAKSRELALAYGLPFLLETGALPGAVVGGNSLNKAAQHDGIPAILAESGGRGLMEEEYVLTHINGMLNVLKHMGMIDGEIQRKTETRELKTEFWRIESEGISYPKMNIGDEVKKGQQIGIVTDWFGELLETVTAPRDAWIVAVVITPAAVKDMIMYQVAY